MATILAPRFRLLLGPAAIALVALSCGDGDGGTGPEMAPVATVAISPPAATIAPGGTVQLAAVAKNAAGGTLTDRSVSWSTSDATVATVSAAGLVTGVADGAVVITATSESKSGSAAITVSSPVDAVEVTPPSATILNAEDLQLAATTKDAAGNPLSDRAVTWSTDAGAVATVSATGTVRGVAPGTATITASAEGKSGTATITVTVLDVAGDWAFSETFSDPANNLTCTNEATFVLAPVAATFTGTADQTGECTVDGEPFDNAGTFEITAGSVQATAISFTQPGEFTCVYEGSLVENPPISASGTVSCTGLIDLFGQLNATGTWQMTRTAASP
ncbi:MAG: Ig domain-containing protein [Gemmatimonadales bacterium]|nr:Ig domain-containing protein [Gemmatimonadales bacterium]